MQAQGLQSVVNKSYTQYLEELHKVMGKAQQHSPYMFGYPNNLKDVARLDDVSLRENHCPNDIVVINNEKLRTGEKCGEQP